MGSHAVKFHCQQPVNRLDTPQKYKIIAVFRFGCSQIFMHNAHGGNLIRPFWQLSYIPIHVSTTQDPHDSNIGLRPLPLRAHHVGKLDLTRTDWTPCYCHTWVLAMPVDLYIFSTLLGTSETKLDRYRQQRPLRHWGTDATNRCPGFDARRRDGTGAKLSYLPEYCWVLTVARRRLTTPNTITALVAIMSSNTPKGLTHATCRD